MDEAFKETGETFKELVIDKIGQMEKQVSSLSGKTISAEELRQQQETLFGGIADFKLSLAQLNENTKTVSFGFKSIKELSEKLEDYTQELKKATEKKKHHVHHFAWRLGVSVGVLLLLVWAVSALYINHQKLDQYIANDTKYRSLQLIKDKNLQHYLYQSDSLYRADPEMRKEVLKLEAERKRKIELLIQVREKQREAEELKRKAGKLGK